MYTCPGSGYGLKRTGAILISRSGAGTIDVSGGCKSTFTEDAGEVGKGGKFSERFSKFRVSERELSRKTSLPTW